MNHRHIPLEGAVNFRDLGGFPAHNGNHTWRGLIFRSGNLSSLTETDRAKLQELGIHTVFDLRLDYELKHEGAGQLHEGVTVINMPTTVGDQAIRRQIESDPDGFRMVDFYCSSLLERTAYHADLFQQILANMDQPLVVHCSAGKDRTGIVAALLLRLAGVSDPDIIADYAETDRHLVQYAKHWQTRFRGFGMPDNVITEMLASSPTTMETFLGYLDEQFGSAENYLMGGGVTAEEIEQFKRAFVE